MIEGHAIGVFIHPLKAKMEKAEKEKHDAALATKRSDDVQDSQPAVAEVDTTESHNVTPVAPAGKGSDTPVQ